MDQQSLPTVSISSVKAIFYYIETQGFNVDALWTGCDLDRSCLTNPDCRISITDYHRIWANAIQETSDIALALHVGEHSNTSEMGLVANVLIHEETLRSSLNQYARLYSLVNDGISLCFEESEHTSTLYLQSLDPSYYSIQDMERTLVISNIRTKLFVHEDIRLTKVGFAHPEPPYADEYQRIFNCPIEFDQPRSFIELETKYLDYAPVRKNPYTRSALLSYSDRLLNKINRRRFSNQVRKHILDLLPHKKADVDEVAKRLHMSRHTLYRKLKVEDLAFQDLIEEIRKEKAVEMVRESNQSLSEVAFLLGFSELSSFSRAFKRWTGQSPKQFRSADSGQSET